MNVKHVLFSNMSLLHLGMWKMNVGQKLSQAYGVYGHAYMTRFIEMCVGLDTYVT